MIVDEIAERILELIDPSKIRVVDYGIGLRYSYVLIDYKGRNYIGLSHTLHSYLRSFHYKDTEIDPGQLVELVSSINPYDKQYGHALLNAMSQCIVLEDKEHRLINDKDPDDLVDIRRDDLVVFIGDIKPLVDRVKSINENVYVFEEDICRRGKVYPAGYEFRVLQDADIVFMTGSVLTNDTFDAVLSYARRAREKIMVGPSAQIVPWLLGDKVTAIASILVLDPWRVRDVIVRGGGTRAINRYSRKYIYRSI